MRIRLPASLLGLLLMQAPGGLPAWPAALALSAATAGFSAPAEARPRSSGGYSRPGGSYRTPSSGSAGSYSRPRTPSSGGYSRPGGVAVPYGGGSSAGDRSYNRAQSADALRRIWLPHGLPVEDGFLAAMLVTDGFTHAPDPNAIAYVADASHFYEPVAGVGDFVRHDAPRPDAQAPWYSLDYTYVMEPGEAVLPRPPIK